MLLRFCSKSFVGFIVLFVSFLLPDSKLSAQQETGAERAVDTEMLPQNALALVAVYPQQVLENPQLKMMPVEIASAWMVENVGVQLESIESIVASVGTPGPQGVDFGFLISLNRDFDAAALNKNLIAGPPELIGGYPAIPLANAPNLFLHRVDAKTYIAATPEHLVNMMAGAGDSGPLAQLVSSRNSSSPIVAAMVMEPVREQLLQGLAQMPPNVPGPLRELAEIPNLLQGAFLDAGMMFGDPMRLTLVGNSSDDTTELATILENAMMFGRDIAVLQAMQEVEGSGPVAEASRNYIRRLGEEITTMLRPEQDGQELVMEVENRAGVATSGVLVGLLLPAVQAAREAARRMSSSNNLKQMMLAFHNYHDAYRHFPQPISRDEDGKPLLSWRVAILPFIEQNDLYEQFHLDEPWDSEHNIKLVEKMPTIYADPSVGLPAGLTVYQVPVGQQLLFTEEGTTSFGNVLDGTSNTIAIFEASQAAAVPWTKPSDAEINQQNPLANMAKYRPGGFNVAFADGSVRFISETIDPQLF